MCDHCVAPAGKLHYPEFSLRLERPVQGDGGVLADLGGRCHHGVVVDDAEHAHAGPEQAVHSGPTS